jgi:hypothetical protein
MLGIEKRDDGIFLSGYEEKIFCFHGECFADRNWLNSTQSCSQKHP